MGLLSVTVSPHPRVTRRATRRRPGPAHGTGQWIGHLASSPHQCPAAVKAMVTLAALPPAITAGRSKTSPPVAARRLKTAAAGRPHSPSPQFWPTGLNAGLLYAELGYALRASAGPARTQTWAAAPAGRPQAGQPDAIRQQLGDAAGARNGDDRPDPAAGQRQPLPRSICRGIVRHATHDDYFPPFLKRVTSWPERVLPALPGQLLTGTSLEWGTGFVVLFTVCQSTVRNPGRNQARGLCCPTGAPTTLRSRPSCVWLRPTPSSSCASAS